MRNSKFEIKSNINTLQRTMSVSRMLFDVWFNFDLVPLISRRVILSVTYKLLLSHLKSVPSKSVGEVLQHADVIHLETDNPVSLRQPCRTRLAFLLFFVSFFCRRTTMRILNLSSAFICKENHSDYADYIRCRFLCLPISMSALD